jgi:hypothetical protein
MFATYFEPVAGIDASEEQELLSMFCETWPGVVVCDEFDAASHPRYLELRRLLQSYPEVTPPGYRAACFLRWLAFDAFTTQGPMLLLDYDVYPRFADACDLDWFVDRFDRPTILDRLNPCMLFLPDASFLASIVDMLFLPTIPNKEPDGPHIGDNTVFDQHWESIGGSISFDVTRPDGDGRFLHFSNNFVAGCRPEAVRSALGVSLNL